jgi:erythromycin esterase-like protein
MNGCMYIPIAHYYWRKKEVLTFATWMNLENARFSERRQSQGVIYDMIPFI